MKEAFFVQGACSTRCWGLSVLTPKESGHGGNGLWGGGVGMFRDPVITMVTPPFPQRPFLWSSWVLGESNGTPLQYFA